MSTVNSSTGTWKSFLKSELTLFLSVVCNYSCLVSFLWSASGTDETLQPHSLKNKETPVNSNLLVLYLQKSTVLKIIIKKQKDCDNTLYTVFIMYSLEIKCLKLIKKTYSMPVKGNSKIIWINKIISIYWKFFILQKYRYLISQFCCFVSNCENIKWWPPIFCFINSARVASSRSTPILICCI